MRAGALAAVLAAAPAFGQRLAPVPVRGAGPAMPHSVLSPMPAAGNAALPAGPAPSLQPALVAPGAAYAQVLAERGWVEHRTEKGSYLLVLRKGVDSYGRAIFVMDALDAADPGRGTVAHVDFAVHPEQKQAVFDGPLDEYTKDPPALPEGVSAGNLSHWREHLWFGLSVHPDYRERGLAGLLMDTAASTARAAGAEDLIIYSTDDSRSLYKKLYREHIAHEESSTRGAEGEEQKIHRLVVRLPEAAPAAAAPRRDKTLRFLAVMDLIRKRTVGPVPESAKNTKTFIVPGLFGNHQGDAYRGNLRRMEELGLKGEILDINTEDKAPEGMAAIEAAVRASPVPVVLVGHSRGGVLVHDWYRLAPAELKAKVSRVVLVQAPLAGTSFANWVIGSAWRRLIVRYLSWRYGADILKTAREMTPKVRAAVLEALPPWTREDLAKVWVLRSVKPPGRSFYGRHAALLKAMGDRDSDGIIPAASAAVPGARDIFLQDVDHSNTMLEKPGWLKRWRGYKPHPDYDVGDITEALMRLLFKVP
ncbi:GNAT family N-acetyltransferase [bacterium]|nr:MAG: GNAT family N-acetyltransferase [bacterium]